MFKADWEKTSVTYPLPEGMVEKMIRLAYPNQKITSFELIACMDIRVSRMVDIR